MLGRFVLKRTDENETNLTESTDKEEQITKYPYKIQPNSDIEEIEVFSLSPPLPRHKQFEHS